MAEQLDVYRDWLGIKETARPLNYYQLLRVKPFEDNTARIRDHYQKMSAHVRKFLAGPHADRAKQLLDELARAMLCLTDLQRKREYDASLGRKEVAEARRRSLEEILVADKLVEPEQLQRAKRFADAVGLELRDALLQQKLASPEAVMLAYAEAEGLPYVDLDEIAIDETLIPQVPPATARQHSLVPVMIDSNQLLVASPRPLVPDVEEDLRLRFDMPVRTVLCAPAKVNQAVAKYYPRDAAYVPAAPRAQEKPKAAPPRPAREEVYRDRDEQIRRSAMCGVIGFNVTVIVVMVICQLLTRAVGLGTSIGLAILLGLIVGGLTYMVSYKFQL